MEKGKLVKDKQISVIKKHLLKSVLQMQKKNNWVELENAIFKITNIRKYESPLNKLFRDKRYIYEFDVVADMRFQGYSWSTGYCKRNPRIANRYYRSNMERAINDDLKYFASSEIDYIIVKKITWQCL